MSSAPSGDQMMLRPGASKMSRIFSPPGSFQMTRRLTQRRGPVTPAAGVTVRGRGPIRSGCCDIGHPLLDLVRQRAHSAREIDSTQRMQNDARATIRPASGVDRLKPRTGCPSPVAGVFDQPTIAPEISNHCSPGSIYTCSEPGDTARQRIGLCPDKTAPPQRGAIRQQWNNQPGLESERYEAYFPCRLRSLTCLQDSGKRGARVTWLRLSNPCLGQIRQRHCINCS
jgi:hypothetical protein